MDISPDNCTNYRHVCSKGHLRISISFELNTELFGVKLGGKSNYHFVLKGYDIMSTKDITNFHNFIKLDNS